MTFQNYEAFDIPKRITNVTMTITNGPLRYNVLVTEFDDAVVNALHDDDFEVTLGTQHADQFEGISDQDQLSDSPLIMVNDLHLADFVRVMGKLTPLYRYTSVDVMTSYSALKREFGISHVLEIEDRNNMIELLVEMNEYFDIMHVEDRKLAFMMGKELDNFEDIVLHQKIMGRKILTIK